jgi:hypothetical protein
MSWSVFNSFILSASAAVRGRLVVGRSGSLRVESSSGWSGGGPRMSSREVMVLSPKPLFSGDARTAARAEEGSLRFAVFSVGAVDGRSESVFGFDSAGALSEVGGKGAEEIELGRRLMVVLGVSIQAPVTLGVLGSRGFGGELNGAWISRDDLPPLSPDIFGCNWICPSESFGKL